MDSLFLSSIYVDDLPKKSIDWSDLAAVHRFVMSRFGSLDSSDEPRKNGGILFRLESVRSKPVHSKSADQQPKLRPRLLVQSLVKPNDTSSTIDISSFLSGIDIGQSCRFRLDVNPVYRQSKTKKDIVIEDSAILPWLATKLSSAFKLDSLVDFSFEYRKAGKNKLAVASVDVLAEVVDKDRVMSLLVDGVGRRKNYGCGLLTLLPKV